MADPRDNAKTIPSSFLELDDNTDSADQPINVRDEQTYWLNHNKLLAHRMRRTVFCIKFNDGLASTSTPQNFNGCTDPQVSCRQDLILSEPIYVSAFCSQLFIKMRAFADIGYQESVGGESAVVVYPVVSRIDQEPQITDNALGEKMSVAISTTQTLANYTSNVTIPDGPKTLHEDSGMRMLKLSLIMESYMDTSKAATSLTASDLTSNWFQTATDISAKIHYYAVYQSGAPDATTAQIEPTMLRWRDQAWGASTTGRNYVAYPFEQNITSLSMEAKPAAGVFIDSINYYELEVTDAEQRYRIGYP